MTPTPHRTRVIWSLPVGMRSAIDMEALRRDVTPSRVVEAILARYLSEFISEAIGDTLRRAGADDLRGDGESPPPIDTT